LNGLNLSAAASECHAGFGDYVCRKDVHLTVARGCAGFAGSGWYRRRNEAAGASKPEPKSEPKPEANKRTNNKN